MFYYVIVTSYIDRFVMILVSMEREDPTLYYYTKRLYFGRVGSARQGLKSQIIYK